MLDEKKKKARKKIIDTECPSSAIELTSQLRDGPQIATTTTTDMTQRRPDKKQRRNRRRRSLFAVLFNQNKTASLTGDDQKSSDESSFECDDNVTRNQRRSNSSISRRKSHHRNDTSDIVLIKPTEARCVEATVASLVNDDEYDVVEQFDSDRNVAAVDSLKKSNQNTTQTTAGEKGSSFFGKRIQRFKKKKKKKKKSRDDDADSYILDLNDCLDREKLRVSSTSTSCSSSISSFSSFSSCSVGEKKDMATSKEKITPAAKSLLRRVPSSRDKVMIKSDHKNLVNKPNEKSKTKDCSPLRESSPIDNLWQTNKEYIPVDETNNNNCNEDHTQKGPSSANLHQRPKRTSPMLVEFLQSHQIHLNVVDSLSLASARNTPGGYSTSSSQDSLACLDHRCRMTAPTLPSRSPLDSRPTLPAASYYDQLAASSPLASVKLNELSESDRRLYHWRKLAARSVSMWQVPENSSSDEEDSNSAEFLDCHGPAMVCYCSDDTSCSSVELIWSRPASKPVAKTTGIDQRELERQRQLLNRPLHLLTPPSRSATPSSSDLNLSSSAASVSPGGLPNVRVNSKSPLPTSQQAQLNLRQNLQVYNLERQNSARSGSSNNSYRSTSDQNRSTTCQKPSILELAKPTRARDRRIGTANEDAQARNKRSRKAKTTGGQVLVDSKRASVADGPMPSEKSLGQACVEYPTKLVEQVVRPQRPGSNGRDWSEVPVSRPASASDWHPNPLFGRLGSPPAETTTTNLLTGNNSKELKERTNSSRLSRRNSVRESTSSPLKQQQTKSCDEPQSSKKYPDVSSKIRLRRHSSLAGNLHQQQDLPTANDSEKYQASSKSNRFMSFLARIRSRQDNTSATVPATELVNYEKEHIKENSDTISVDENDGFGSNNGRARRQRWSLRMRSPFTTNHNNVAARGTYQQQQTTNSDHAYLSQVSANLDKLKSQLSERISDTGKRASVFADQLISTIKDTTKEQLLIATTGTTARDRYDTLPNSFATNNNGTVGGSGAATNDPLLVRKQIKQDDGFNTNDRKAKMFSLIYMHQQQQADGRPVITRQPTSSTRRPDVVSSYGNNEQARFHATTGNNNRPQSISICQQDARVSNNNTANETLIDLDELLDPKELLMDKFRALKSRARELERSSQMSGMASQRLTQTIATGAPDSLVLRRNQVTNQSLSAKNSDDPAPPKRRSSCTV